MSKTVLITLGRLPKGLDIARGFARAGCRVIIAEPFRWHLCRPSRDVARCYAVTAPAANRQAYRDELLAIVEREGVELVVPISEEIMHAAALHGRLPPQVRLFAPPQQQLLRLHHKLQFIRLAQSYGLPVPQSAALDEAPAAAIAASGDFVIKPVFSCSGKGVQILQRGSALPLPARGLATGEAAGAAQLVQAFVPGQVHSTFSLAHQGRVQVTAIYRGTIMSGTVAVGFEQVQVPAIDRWVQDFVAASGHSGFISFDFVVEQSGRALAIECNPRVTSGMHFVEAQDLARAILDPAAAPAIRLRPEKLLQQFFPCLTETQKSLLDADRRRHHWHYLRQAQDVSWSWRDPLPFLTMPLTASQILAKSWLSGLSLGEAATRDIEWYGEPD